MNCQPRCPPRYQIGHQLLKDWTRIADIDTVAALRFPEMLRRLSWQQLAGHLAIHEPLNWLVDGLRRKYRIIGQL